MPEDLHDIASDGASSSSCSVSVVQVFDQAIAELTDEIVSKRSEGRASLEACLRRRCAHIVDQQLEAFREQAAQREQEAAARRDERNEAVRQVLELKERQHKEALDAATATAATATATLESATASAAVASAAASALAAAKLSEAHSKARSERISTVASVMGRGEVWRSGTNAHLIFLLWQSWSKSSQRSRPLSEPSEPPAPIVAKSTDKGADDRILIKPVHTVLVGSENEPPQNGQAISHPQGPPPAHPPRDRPVLRSVRSDGSMTPARPAGTCTILPPPDVAAPTVQLTSAATATLPLAQAASPSIVCRVESSRQPRLGDSASVNQRSTGSLPIASGDVAWGAAATRAPSAERQQHAYRQPSPTPRTRPPALASPNVPLAPQFLQQSMGQHTPTGYRGFNAPGSSLVGSAQPQAQTATYNSATAPRAVTPRSTPPTGPMQVMTAPSAAWQASGPGVAAATPRGNSGSFVAAPPGGNSGSFAAAPPGHPPTTVHGFAAGTTAPPPQRAASGPAGGGGPVAQQPTVSQMSPPQGTGQLARLRQGSPLGRSRTIEWGSQPPAQTAQAYARPHSAWGHVS